MATIRDAKKIFSRVFGRYAIFFVIIIFFCLTALIQFSEQGLFSIDDPYYHVRHAYTYWSGETMNLPTSSTWADVGNLYIFYHILMSPFLSGFDGQNFETLIIGAKLFHTLVVTLLFTVFFIVARSILRSFLHNSDALKANSLALCATFFLFFANNNFITRMMLNRPHVVATLFFLLVYYFTVKKKWLWLFVASALFPLFYSVTFLIMIVPAIYFITSWFTERKITRPSFYPSFAVVGGLALGILIRPHSLQYIYNAYYLGVITVFNGFFGITAEGMELNTQAVSLADNVWFLFSLCVICFFLWTTKKVRERQSVPFEQYFTVSLTVFLFCIFIMIQRVSEYFVPLLIISFFWIFIQNFLPLTKQIRTVVLPEKGAGRVLFEFVQSAVDSVFGKNKYVFKIFLWCFISVMTVFTSLFITRISGFQKPYDQYKNAALFMQEHSEPKDVVFIQRFDMYPQLVFFNNHNAYIIGGSNTGTYMKDRSKYWQWLYVTHGDIEKCKGEVCNFEKDIYTIIKQTFDASIVFIDASKTGSELTNVTTEKLIQNLDNNIRFQKVFVDPRNEKIMVYKVL